MICLVISHGPGQRRRPQAGTPILRAGRLPWLSTGRGMHRAMNFGPVAHTTLAGLAAVRGTQPALVPRALHEHTLNRTAAGPPEPAQNSDLSARVQVLTWGRWGSNPRPDGL